MLTKSKKSREERENKKPTLSNSRMQSVVIKDNAELQKLNQNLLEILKEAKSDVFQRPVKEARNEELALIDKLVSQDPDIANKYYEKDEVVKMINITNDHLRKLELDVKNSVSKYKGNLEKYEEVLAAQQAIVGQLTEDVRDIREQSYTFNRDVARDTDSLEDVLKGKTALGRLALLEGYREQYDDGLFEGLTWQEQMRFVLVLENRLMDQFFAEMSKEKKKTLTCRNCKQYFDKESNHMKACFKHTGQLKYEPCLNCKKIELFTCCGYCESCSFGCTPFEHISIV